MNQRVLRIALRGVAIAIAIAALIDPVWTIQRPERRDLIAIDVATDGSAAIEALRAAARDWNVITRTADAALPCAAGEHCVVVADGSTDVDLPADLSRPLSVIRLTPAGGPNVAVRSVAASATHVAAAGLARVEIERTGAVASTDIRIIDEGAVVGSAAHQWAEGNSATVDVPWWPLDAGARRLRIEAVPIAEEAVTVDNVVDSGIDVGNARMSVLVFDTRPSWSSTFVRRVLEDDPRFSVAHRARIAPSLSSGTTNARLDADVLDTTALLVVGAPDALTASDVDLIDRYVRVRGGTVVLLPERRPSGPSARLFDGEWTEHLSSKPERIGDLSATEVLRLSAAGPSATVLAGTPPAIVAMPKGRGRIVISGAMDAWRYRDEDGGAFDRFWRSLAAEGAVAGAPLMLTLETPLISRTAAAKFIVRDRRMTSAASIDASAVMTCGEQPAQAVRLWPTGTFGEFSGEASSSATGACTVEAMVNDRRVVGGFAVADHPRRAVTTTLRKLERAARDSGGIIVDAGGEEAIVRAISAERQSSSQIVSARPMRAPWWMMLFAGCLTVEWWLRRRDGLR